MFLTVSLDHDLKKGKSWKMEGCVATVMRDKDNDLLLHLHNKSGEKVVSLLDLRSRVLGGKGGSILVRSSQAGGHLKFNGDASTVSSMKKVLESIISGSFDGETEEYHTKMKKKSASSPAVIDPSLIVRSEPATPIRRPAESPLGPLKIKSQRIEYQPVTFVPIPEPLSRSISLTNRSTADKENEWSNQRKRRTYLSSEGEAGGFQNLGSTCFAAVVLQFLYHSRLRAALLKARNKVRDVAGNATVLEAFADVFQRKADSESVSLKDVLLSVSKAASFCNKFAEREQEDAHEFLMACLDQLSLEDIKQENLPDPVGDELEFVIQHTLTCISCEYTSKHDEKYRDLSLALGASIPSMLEGFFGAEEVDYNCPDCTSKKAIIRHRLCHAPSTLLLHMNRFDTNLRKRNDAIEIPLSISLEAFSSSIKDTCYSLVGIVSHLGLTMQHGHYIYNHRSESGWTTYNDARVEIGLNELDVASQSSGYLISYQRIS